MRVAEQLAIIAIISLFATGQVGSRTATTDWQAPPEAARRANPLPKKTELIEGGRKIFLRECSQCHAASGAGGRRKNAADLRSEVVQSQSDGALFWKITHGNSRSGMPSWSRLPEPQRWQLVLFIRELAKP